MNNYYLTQSLKTKILNLFRRLFTLPFFENLLVALVLNSSSRFLQKLIPPNYLYKKESFRNVTRQGIKFRLDISNLVDHYLYYAITDSSYASILDELKNSRVILDIGANIGATALYFASINPKAQILAFEPHPETFKRAQENLALNTFENIRLINIGLGVNKETLKLYEVNENNPGMNRILPVENNLPFKEVYIEALDKVLLDRNITSIDFIKLDVEGFEYAVLMGGKEAIQRSKPILFIELDDNNLKENNKSAKELIDLLLSFGYKDLYAANSLVSISSSTNFDNCHFDIIAK